jgi:chaperonin cofactor prefoldin
MEVGRHTMTEAIAVACITGGLAVLGNVIIAIMNSKLTIYRIEQLEKKVEKHNNLVERVAVIERDEQTQWKRIDELRAELEK